MPSSYSLYQMISFPYAKVGDTIAPLVQLPFESMGFDKPPRTELYLNHQIADLKIDVFRAIHEFVVRKSGRAKGEEFTEYIEIKRFPVYYESDLNLLMFKTNKNVAHGAMQKLKKHDEIDGNRRAIDLSSVKQRIERFKGVWFSIDGSADISSQAFFGPSVDRDLRFERALSEGSMYYVRFDHQYNDELFHVGVSDDCNVVIFDDHLDEHLELELVLDVKQKFLDFAVDRTDHSTSPRSLPPGIQ